MIDQQFTTEELNSEDWKVIPGFEKYEASNLGRVRRIEATYKRAPGYILKQRVRASKCSSYLVVCLQANKGERHVSVHRAVALAFLLPQKASQTQINHKDGDTHNNRVTNLEWVSPRENSRHAIEVLKKNHSGENHPQAKLTKEQVVKIHELRMQGVSGGSIAKMFNVAAATVSQIITRRGWGDALAGLPTNYPSVSCSNHRKGEACNKARITTEIAIDIKKRILSRQGVTSISRETGVAISIIKRIKSGATWKHVTI